MIPKVIYMCDKELTFIEKYSQNWKKLNPEYEIKLYDDSMCEQFLLNEYSQLHYEIFKYIKDGPIKADFWRVCVLFKYGGVYVDADIEPLVPISQIIEKDVDFVTCSSYYFYTFFNPNFIMAKAGDKILEKCINIYINKYLEKHFYLYMTWSIVTIMSHMKVIDTDKIQKKFGVYKIKSNGINEKNSINIQILEEVQGTDRFGDHMIYNNIKIFNNRYSTYDEENHKFIS